MEYAVQDLRDLLAVARMLRHFADQESHDEHSELFLDAAQVLEERAHFIAESGHLHDDDRTLERRLRRDSRMHSHVNLLI